MNKKLQKKPKKFLIKTLIILIVFVFFNLVFKHNALAATLILSTPNEKVHQQEQFFVDISLMPNQGESVNGFDLLLSHSSNLKFIGQENGSSIVGLWVEKPSASLNTVHLSGIIPGGFTGIINPLETNSFNNQKPGILTRLIFSGNEEGEATLHFSNQNILANDGLGTILSTSSNILTLFIDKKINPSTITTNDTVPPGHFSVLLSKDPLLFGGRYVLIFEAKDKESGIDYYEIKEIDTPWKKAKSPYLLTHQPPVGTIYVRAFDKAGNNITEELTPNIPASKIPIFSKILAVFMLLVLAIIVYLIIIFIRFIKRKISHVL